MPYADLDKRRTHYRRGDVSAARREWQRQWRAGFSPEQRAGKRAYERGYQWPWEKADQARRNAMRGARRYGLDPGTLTKEIFARLHLLPCAYCGVMPAMGADHVWALGMGGPNTIENLAPACSKCNQQKTGEK